MTKPAQLIAIDGRCTANSKRTGERCNRTVEAGANVCYYHGGAAPQVREHAARRLAELLDLAIDRLQLNIVMADPATAGRAAMDVLDRLGVKSDTVGEILTAWLIAQQAGLVPENTTPEFDAKVETLLIAKLERYQTRRAGPTDDGGTDEPDETAASA